MGVLTAYGHVFRPVETSASIGWSTSPYEYEVGMADLTVGVLGVLCLKFRSDFWLATAIANAVWLLGDAVGHVRQMILNNNHASNNSGIFLVTEIIMPLVILFLTLYHRRRDGKSPGGIVRREIADAPIECDTLQWSRHRFIQHSSCEKQTMEMTEYGKHGKP
jgi:hypothetical protein